MKLITFEDGNAGGVRVRIRDANGNEHAFYHMQVGSAGKSSGPHLHYEIWKKGNSNNRPNPATIHLLIIYQNDKRYESTRNSDDFNFSS